MNIDDSFTNAYASLLLNMSIPNNSCIVAITQFQKKLAIAYDNNMIYICDIHKQNGKLVALSSMEKIDLNKDGCEIKQLDSFDDNLLILAKFKKGTGGIFMYSNKEIKLQIKNVNCFSLNRKTITSHTTFMHFLLVGHSDKSVSLHVFKGKLFKKIWSKTFEQEISNVAINYPYLLTITPNKIMQITYSKDKEILNEIPTAWKAVPTAIPFNNDLFMIHIDGINMVMKDLNSNQSTICFQDAADDIANNGSLFAYLINNMNVVYIFNFEGIQEFSILEKPKLITSFNKKFLVASDQRIYYLLRIQDIIDEIESNIPINNIDLEILIYVFVQLWYSNRKKTAISLLTKDAFQAAIPLILHTFDFFVLPFDKIISSDLLNKLEPTLPNGNKEPFLKPGKCDKEIYLSLFKALDYYQSTRIVSNEFINTALCQLLIKINDPDLFYSFLDQNMRVDQECMSKFFEKKSYELYPFYLAYLEKYEQALNTLEKNMNYDYYCKILLMGIQNKSFVMSHIDFLMQNAPLKGCDVLLNEKMPIQTAINFIETNYPSFLPYIIHRIFDKRITIDQDELANVFTEKLLFLISTINQPNFDRKSILFTKSISSDPNAPIDVIEEELSETLCQFLMKYHSLINMSQIFSKMKIDIKNLHSQKLKLELCKLMGQVQKAFEFLYSQDEQLTKCEEFCEREQSPEILQTFLIFIKEKMNSEDFSNYVIKIISKFIKFVDIEKALSLISEETSLDLIGNELENSFTKINQRRNHAELKIVFAESEEFESSYERTKLECNSIILYSYTVCSICHSPLGFCFVQKTADGKLCHLHCLPSNK